MLDGLRLRGLRSLGDTGLIEFRPITLLLGQNSSGKSTFLRSLPLLRQSIRTRTNSPVLWYGDLVDFGSFQEVLSTFSENGIISFDFSVTNLRIVNPYYPVTGPPRIYKDAMLAIGLQEADDFTRLSSLTISIGSDTLQIAVDRRGSVQSLVFNGKDFTRSLGRDRFSLSRADIVPQVISGADKATLSSFSAFTKPLSLTEGAIYDLLAGHFDRRVSETTIRTLLKRISYYPEAEFVTRINTLRSDLVSWSSVKAQILGSPGERGIEHLRGLYMIGMLPELLYSMSSSVSGTIRDLAYVGPSRATGERYYRHQELAVDQIDPQGQNLAMYLYSLEPTTREEFSAWLEREIGYSLQVGRRGGHIQIELRERGGQSFHNLADMGYGFSQILPVMAQIWGRKGRQSPRYRTRPFVAIEQPELHLHPAYQARIADVFANSIRDTDEGANQVTFLVETHSEALINRLGELIYEDKLSEDDVAIYLFHRSAKADSTKVSQAKFNKEGLLVDWPLGFFSSRSRV